MSEHNSKHPSRPRKDPRNFLVTEGRHHRKRISRSQTAHDNAFDGSQKSSVKNEPQVKKVIVEQPDYYVVVVPDILDGALTRHDRDVIAVARSMVDDGYQDGQGAVLVVLFDEAETDLRALGADRVLYFTEPDHQGSSINTCAAVLNDLMGAENIACVLCPDSVGPAADIGRMLAAKRKTFVASGVCQVSGKKLRQRIANGRIEAERPIPDVMLLLEDVGELSSGCIYEARPYECQLSPEADNRVENLGNLSVDPNDIDITEAPFILSGGNGIADWQAFLDLGQNLGATIAGSRVVVDKGLIDRDRQVGASGKITSARCYIAMGISGAPQHMQGILDCEYVVAINTDAGCPMAERADLVVVGDASEIAQSLSDKITQQRGDHDDI